MSKAEKNEYEIDYMHPDGKPLNAQTEQKDDEYILVERSMQKSIDEADGHHMCSSECQKHHQV